MSLTENDLKDLLAERADIPAARPGRLEEVRHRIRRRKVAKGATAVVAAASAITVVLVGVPMVAGGNDTNGLTVAGSPTATSTPAPVPSRSPSGPVHLTREPRSGKVTVETVDPQPDTSTGPSLPPAKYTIRLAGDGYRVHILEMGDLAGLREDLRQRGVRVVGTPSKGFEECLDGDYSDGPTVVDPGVWEFVVRPGDHGADREADRELRLWNGPAFGELLFLHYCRSLR